MLSSSVFWFGTLMLLSGGEFFWWLILFSISARSVLSCFCSNAMKPSLIVLFPLQALKDVLRSPRPAMPPAVRMELRWDNEFGLPSTHSMMAVALPLSLLLLTSHTQYWSLSLVTAISAFLLVTSCRLYLGMHTILDILVGILLSALILGFALPLGMAVR